MLPRALTLLTPLLLAFAAAGCIRYPMNEYLPPPYSKNLGYRYDNLTASIANTDSVLVCLSLSGGGVRAGSLAYGVIRALGTTRISGGRRLLDEVDIISAASGGSFAAAYLGAFGFRPFLNEFREKVLLRDLGMETFWQGSLCPYNTVRLCSPWFNRSDLADDLYRWSIFGDMTYADLKNRGRPFIVLNGTDLAEGSRFEFTQDRFDRLGSSLSRVNLSRAVAASSAFPILLTPVAFQDYTRDEHWVHVVDGGVVDNLGLGFVLDSYRRGVIHEQLATGKVTTLVFIIVNARNRPYDDIGESPQAPGAITVLTRGLGAAIDRRADDMGELLVELASNRPGDNGGGPSPAIHVVEVDLDDLPDPEQRERLLGVPTTYGLDEEVVDELIEVGGALLLRSPEFQKLEAALR